MTHVGERAIAVVVIQRQRHSGINFLIAVCPHAVKFADPRVVEVDLRVIANQQIEIAVPVVVKPNCTGRPSALVLCAGLFRNICKSAVAVVVEERCPRRSGDVKICVAVIVIVPCSYSHAVKRQAVNASLLGDIFEFSVAQIVIEGIPDWGAREKCRGDHPHRNQ